MKPLLPRGSLNRLVRIENNTADESFTGAGKANWTLIAEVWADVQDMLPSRGEKLADGLNIATRPARIRILYRTDVTAAMRIVMGERVMQIVSPPAELGNREGLELMAEDYSTAGGS
ncbi:head-tail adaptor protein [Qipengyuania atrilutea]|uniref:Head-tail adaptor protein n=1 Tax=Qipengyuania atrilutea TaxID=2744473 RepID=A0A850GZQ6_9SPHN|nr:head-tail adaptor protein [Actirhodobacter atriluteus]NVD43482.1 head-tail adaptor protein [Actirhodobacter atriluteus]